MHGSERAFGSRALKRPSRWLQLFASRRHSVLLLPKNKKVGEVATKSEIMGSCQEAVAVKTVVRFMNFNEFSPVFLSFHELSSVLSSFS